MKIMAELLWILTCLLITQSVVTVCTYNNIIIDISLSLMLYLVKLSFMIILVSTKITRLCILRVTL